MAQLSSILTTYNSRILPLHHMFLLLHFQCSVFICYTVSFYSVSVVGLLVLGGRWSLGPQQQTVPQGPLKR